MTTEAPPTVIVPAQVFEQIEDAIRVHHLTFIHAETTEAGLQNLLLWPTPHANDTIMLIRGES